MLTVGVDLAKRKSQFAVVDESGKVIAECKLPNDKETVQKFLRSLPGKVQVGCETCTNTYWLVELVEELQIPMFVGHALNLRLIAQSRIKTDKIDARVIAELLRVGFFPTIAIPPKEVRQVRELLRGRIQVSRTLAQAKNRLHGVLSRAGVDYEKAQAMGAGAEAWLESLELPEGPKFMAWTFLAMIPELSERAQQIEKELLRQVRLVDPWGSIVQRLATIPGVGMFSAMLLLLELWEVTRFPSAKHLASYVGIVPSVHQTGQTLRGGPLTKQGNRSSGP